MSEPNGTGGRVRRWLQRPPPNYRPGSVLARLARDLQGHRMDRLAAGQAWFVPRCEGPAFSVVERPERHALMSVTTTAFLYDLGGPPGDALVELRHTGAVRRTGVTGRVKRGNDEAADLLARVLDDPAFVKAVIPLDFTRLELRRDSGGWHAEAALMGGSEVAMRLPPTRSYVKLSGDQYDALVLTFSALDRLVT